MSLRGAMAGFGRPLAETQIARGAATYGALFVDRAGRPLASAQRCRDVLGPLRMGDSFHAVTEREWSYEHALAWAVDQAPSPPTLRLATWTMSGAPVTRLLAARAAGLLASVTIAAHWRVRVYGESSGHRLLLAALPPVPMTLGEIHAKMMLLECPATPERAAWQVSILTSANFTENPRIEAYTVTTDRETYDQHVAVFDGWSEEA